MDLSDDEFGRWDEPDGDPIQEPPDEKLLFPSPRTTRVSNALLCSTVTSHDVAVEQLILEQVAANTLLGAQSLGTSPSSTGSSVAPQLVLPLST